MAEVRETPQSLRTRWALARLALAANAAPEGCAWHGPMIHAMGLVFPGPVGLAAGFDRRGVLAGSAHRLGFGSVEVGTWAGAAPRLAAVMVPGTRLSRRAVCGFSIGKRPATPWTRAEDDFLAALGAVPAAADYVTLNPGRDCPTAARFSQLVAILVAARDDAVRCRSKPLPIVVKLPAPWLAGSHGVHTAVQFVTQGADGLLLSAEGTGTAAPDTLRAVARALRDETCLISVGGIHSAREAVARMQAGAHLIQLHRGVCKGGTRLMHALNRRLAGVALRRAFLPA